MDRLSVAVIRHGCIRTQCDNCPQMALELTFQQSTSLKPNIKHEYHYYIHLYIIN